MRHITLAVTLLVLGGAGHEAGAVTYAVTDLGTLGGARSFAVAINDQGQVVGESQTTEGTTHAFLYESGVMMDLGTLAGHNTSRAQDINNAGQVVGASFFEDAQGNQTGTRPFLYASGSMANLGSLGGDYGSANGINATGLITGISARSDAVTHAFLDVGGTFSDLGALVGGLDYSDGYGINDLGDVVGVSVTASGERAFSWHAGTLADLGALPGGTDSSRAYRLNNLGQIVGESSALGATVGHAVRWDQGVIVDLETLASFNSSLAQGINDAGVIVGNSYEPGAPFSRTSHHAFVWEAAQGLQDLNLLLDSSGEGWTISVATDISALGQIVGLGITPLGAEHAVLLTPIPEPTAALLVAIGLMSLLPARHASRRRR